MPDKDGRKPQPWLSDLHPTSTQQPGITCLDKKFRHHWPLDMEASYPYEYFDDTVHYFEFRGEGPPPSDIGYPGDIYIDLTEGSPAVYAMGITEWVLWHGHLSYKAGHRDPREIMPFFHPLLRDRILWCSEKTAMWYSHDTIRRDPRFSKDSVLASCFISKVLEYEQRQVVQLGKRDREEQTDDDDDDDEVETVERIIAGKKARLDVRVNASDFRSELERLMLAVQKRWQTEVDCHKLEQEAKRDAHKMESYEIDKSKLESQVLLLNEKIRRRDKETVDTAKENDRLMEQKTARWAEERASLLAENEKLKIDIQQLSEERKRDTSQIDEKPLLEDFAMRDDALDGLPDSIKGDIDLHTKHFLSVIKDKADALRRMEQAEGTIADKDCRISILLKEMKSQDDARAQLQEDMSTMIKRIEDLTSERDQALAKAEAGMKELHDAQAKMMPLLEFFTKR